MGGKFQQQKLNQTTNDTLQEFKMTDKLNEMIETAAALVAPDVNILVMRVPELVKALTLLALIALNLIGL
jgi:hypothetical protein